jgi:hypothetical protein
MTGDYQVKRHTMLIIASLLSILLLTFHFTDDILREGGLAVHGAADLIALPILGLLLYGTLVLAERRGYLIMLLASLFAMGMPVLHIALARTVIANDLAGARGDYFFVWGLLMLGVTGLFSFVLSVSGLWKREWAQPR